MSFAIFQLEWRHSLPILELNSLYIDGTMSSPASFSNLDDKLSGPEELFYFSSLTFLHILYGEISIRDSSGGDVSLKVDL